jgi:hypothetical protein
LFNFNKLTIRISLRLLGVWLLPTIAELDGIVFGVGIGTLILSVSGRATVGPAFAYRFADGLLTVGGGEANVKTTQPFLINFVNVY